VARLELQAPIDPADAPWPERENLRGKTQPGTASSKPGSGPSGENPVGAHAPDRDASGTDHSDTNPEHSGTEHGNTSHGERGSADRSRTIKPARFTRSGGQAEPAAEVGKQASQAPGSGAGEPAAAGTAGPGEPALEGPRDYELDECGDDDLDEDGDDRYIPPPLPPQPGLDPIAKGAWVALFGGPAYLLVATLLGWEITGWAALTAVVGFVAGFVVLVSRLGDGPSKRDGPDQGAVV
jgi:hypothetical protein